MHIIDCMWQKLNHLDLAKLEHARNQIINVLQLVNGGPRSFAPDELPGEANRVHWDKESNSFKSNRFGPDGDIFLALDIEQLILSIMGPGNQREHLVLSGMTYPMAFGWLTIKLENLGLNANNYNDDTDYKIEYTMKPWEEIDTSQDRIYDQIPLYYSNAEFVLKSINYAHLKNQGNISAATQTADLVLSYNADPVVNIGFSLGNRPFPEPYYYIRLNGEPEKIKSLSGMWNERSNELLIMASDFISKTQERDFERVIQFYDTNLAALINR